MGTKPDSLFSIHGAKKPGSGFFLLPAAFLCISLTGIIVSAHVAFSLKNSFSAIDAAGRRRMLTQRMMSRAFMLSHERGRAVREGRESLKEFEETLYMPGRGRSAAGAPPSPAPREIRPFLEELEAQWRVFKPDYEWLLENPGKSGSAGFKLRLNKLEAQSEPLLAAAQEITVRLRLRSQSLLNTAIKLLLALAVSSLAIFILAFRAMRRDLLAGIRGGERISADCEKMAGIIQQASEAVFVTETDGRITYVNKAFEKMTGFTAEEALGNKPNLLRSGQHPGGYYAEIWTNVRKGLPWTGRIVNKKKDGSLCTVQANIFPLRNSAGETTAYVAIQENVSALEEVEEQLRQAQKMEAVGRLAGGVAHDFNNILMAIDSYAMFIFPALRGNAQAEADFAEIKKSVDKAVALTRQLLAFSRKQKTAFQPLDLRKAVMESEKMLKRLIGEDVFLEISAVGDIKTIKADPGQMDQVLMNLLVNAKDAMPEGGGIKIRTLPHKLALPVSTPLGTMPPGEYSVLSVEDTGSGMDRETLSKIFDPFFTTKPKGKGTGLGLSIVYGIIKHHAAYMTVASQPGKGSTFTAYFPVLTEPDLEPARALPKTAAVVPSGITVFLAEDDPAVMTSVTRILREFGVNMKPFLEPAKMLEFAAGYAGDIHLLITDTVMPGMDGFALAEQITRHSPKAAVIYMSGYSDHEVFKGRLEKPGTIFLQKPFRPELLVEAVSRALAAKRAA